MKYSTGLRTKMLDTGSFRSIMNGGFVKIYSGAVPAGPDDALGAAVLLCTISVNGAGGGLNFAASAVAGTIVKSASEVWSGTNVASGTASFFRFVKSGDTGASSTTEERVQGTVGIAGADCILSSTTLTVSATQTIDSCSFAIPVGT